MIGAQRNANPQIPPEFWDVFMAHARRDTTKLIDMLVPIYAAHLTRSELDELVRFYTSRSSTSDRRSARYSARSTWPVSSGEKSLGAWWEIAWPRARKSSPNR